MSQNYVILGTVFDTKTLPNSIESQIEVLNSRSLHEKDQAFVLRK